jgi:hypothetical protein
MATPDRRSVLIDAYENAAVIVSGISPDQLRNATPCRGYDGAEVPPPPGANDWERVAAFTGRDPRARLTPSSSL